MPRYIIQTTTRCSSQKDRDDSPATSWEQQPRTHCSIVCVIDPSNGDTGCYSHPWEDQTIRKEPSASAGHTPNWAASIHYAFFVRKTAGSKHIFPLSEEKKKQITFTRQWYARLESTSVIPDSESTAQAGSFRKGRITPLTTNPSGNGFMKTITSSWVVLFHIRLFVAAVFTHDM